MEFKGELTQEEADYVISTGLNFLLQNGALPFQVVDEESDMLDMPMEGPKGIQ